MRPRAAHRGGLPRSPSRPEFLSRRYFPCDFSLFRGTERLADHVPHTVHATAVASTSVYSGTISTIASKWAVLIPSSETVAPWTRTTAMARTVRSSAGYEYCGRSSRACGELGNAEIAERTGLPKATVSRLTQTLVVTGMLQRDDRLRVYRLAPAVLSLAHAMRLSSPILPVIAPLMRTEATRGHVNVGLAAADDDMMVYLESVSLQPARQLPYRRVGAAGSDGVNLSRPRLSVGDIARSARPRACRDRQAAPERAAQASSGHRTVTQGSGRSGLLRRAVATRCCRSSDFLLFRQVATALTQHSVASDEPLGDAKLRLRPWLLDLKRRCLEKLELKAAPDVY